MSDGSKYWARRIGQVLSEDEFAQFAQYVKNYNGSEAFREDVLAEQAT